MADGQSKELNDEIQRIWNTNAEWWDDKIGDGNDFQRLLIEPASERLLGDITGQLILDIGCGAGRFTRRMAELGAKVVAFDFCERFIQRARQRTPAETPVEYHLVDVTDFNRLLEFGKNRFDQSVATMSLMDMAEIEPLFRALAMILKPNGQFICTIQHPCFQPPGMTSFAEQSEKDGVIIKQNGVKITNYLTPFAYRGIGIVGQPEPHYYFHRPLAYYLNTAFSAGFILDGFEEPNFPTVNANHASLRWDDMPEIPPILAMRFRPKKV